MIVHKYGDFSEDQMNEYKKKLHNKIFWLLLYKDPKETIEITDEEFESYFLSILLEVNGLNSLFDYPVEIVELVSKLEFARETTTWDDFNFKGYRKLILDAESLVDKICSEEVK